MIVIDVVGSSSSSIHNYNSSSSIHSSSSSIHSS